MSTLVKENTTEIVSFEQYKPKITDANKIILKFLKESYENKKIINKEDIFDLYCLWKFGKGKMTNKKKYTCGYYDQLYYHDTVTGEKRFKRIHGRIYGKDFMSKEDYINQYGNKPKMILWFKNNLGAVILKGKLVVLPIIEV
jgi:hypothetical protein